MGNINVKCLITSAIAMPVFLSFIDFSVPQSHLMPIIYGLFFDYLSNKAISLYAILGISTYCLFSKIADQHEKKLKYENIWIYCFSILFGLAFYLSKSYFLLKNWNLAFYSVQSTIFSLSVIFSISFISSIFIKCIYYLLEYMNNQNAKIFYISPQYYFIALFLINLIYLVVFYPGVATYDGIYQILEFYNLKTLSNHLPVLSTIIEGSIFHCGSIIKDNNFGLFLYVFLQSMLQSALFSYAISLVQKLTKNIYLVFFTFLFFLLNPIFQIWGISFVKDTMYYIGFLWFVLIIIRILEFQEIQIIKIGIYLKSLSDKISESGYSDEYLDLYVNVLKNHRRLFALLHEKNRRKEEHEILFSMFNFYPSVLASIEDDQMFGQVVDEFYCQFWGIALELSENNRSEFLKFINELMNRVKYPQEKRNICVVLKSLMVKAVEKENLSFLTELCYLQIKFVNHLINEQNQQPYDDKIENISIKLRNIANALQKRRKDLKNSPKYYQGILAFSLIQAGVKTIELSQYTLTGFLVKYIVTNFNYEEISNAIYNVLDKKIYQDEKLNSLELTKLLNVYFSINPRTAVYCMKKLILLIQAQQEFQYNNNSGIISFNILQKYNGDEFYRNDNFTVNYCIEKILSVDNKYGLLALKQTENES